MILKAKPELANKCDWKKLPTWNQIRILRYQPELASFADISNAKGCEITELLKLHPNINITVPWERLTGEDWSFLLCGQPPGDF